MAAQDIERRLPSRIRAAAVRLPGSLQLRRQLAHRFRVEHRGIMPGAAPGVAPNEPPIDWNDRPPAPGVPAGVASREPVYAPMPDEY